MATSGVAFIIHEKKMNKEFEVKVSLPITMSHIFSKNDGDCGEMCFVSINEAIRIREVIDQQLKGLKATEPKVKSVKKKSAKKK